MPEPGPHSDGQGQHQREPGAPLPAEASLPASLPADAPPWASALFQEIRQTREALETLVSTTLQTEIPAATQDPQAAALASRSALPFETKSAYTYKEAAAIWQVSYRTVQGWVASRKVLTINLGGPRIPFGELERVWRKGIRRRSTRAA